MNKLIKNNYNQWIRYCNALSIDHKQNYNRKDKYYLQGFENWLSLNSEFKYYQYMGNNV